MKEISEDKIITWSVLTVIVIFTLIMSFYIVPAGKMGIEFPFGNPDTEPTGEDLHCM